MEITIFLSICILALLVCSFIVVPQNTLAIRRNGDNARYLPPGFHIKWPWHSFTNYPTFVYGSEELAYYALTSDRAHIHIKFHIQWTQFESFSMSELSDILFKHISSTIARISLEDIRSSRTFSTELVQQLKCVSNEAGYYLFKIEVLSILEEVSMFSSVANTVESTGGDVDNVRELPTTPMLKPILSSIPGGMRGQPYRKNRALLAKPTHLRLVKPDDDSS